MPHCAPCTRPHCFRTPAFDAESPSIPPKGEGTKVGGVGIPPPSTGINGNRRSNRVFFQLMARRMIGDETRVARGWGRK